MTPEQQYYWELVLRDGTSISVPPSAVAAIKQRWEAGMPVHTRTQGSIAAQQIAVFVPTERVFGATLIALVTYSWAVWCQLKKGVLWTIHHNAN